MRYQLRQAGVRAESTDDRRAALGPARWAGRSPRAGSARIRTTASAPRSLRRSWRAQRYFVAVGLGVADGDVPADGVALPDGVGDGVGVKAAPALSTNDLNCAAFATLPV